MHEGGKGEGRRSNDKHTQGIRFSAYRMRSHRDGLKSVSTANSEKEEVGLRSTDRQGLLRALLSVRAGDRGLGGEKTRKYDTWCRYDRCPNGLVEYVCGVTFA